MQTSTDLTIYEVSETLDDTTKAGNFKLTRKSLEKGLPFEQSCPHSHKNAHEASMCDFFSKQRSIFEILPKEMEAA